MGRPSLLRGPSPSRFLFSFFPSLRISLVLSLNFPADHSLRERRNSVSLFSVLVPPRAPAEPGSSRLLAGLRCDPRQLPVRLCSGSVPSCLLC